MKELGPDVPLHFTAFHPDFKMMDVAATPAATVARARRIAMDEGLRYVAGNVLLHGRQRCPCASPPRSLIVRDWHSGHRGRAHSRPMASRAAVRGYMYSRTLRSFRQEPPVRAKTDSRPDRPPRY